MRRRRRLSVTLLIVAALLLAAVVMLRPAQTQASAMVFPRFGHTATLLSSGKLLVTGGTNATAAELYDPASDSWALTGAMRFARTRHVALALADGRVLVLGGNGEASVGELYDPATGRWSPTAELAVQREEPGAAQLANGQVLVVGGIEGNAINALYNPATNTWSEAAPNLTGPRVQRPAVLALADGRALVVGGNIQPPYEAELYDPSTDSWTLLPLGLDGYGFLPQSTLVQLADGRVLILGMGPVTVSMLFDPATNQLSPAAALPFWVISPSTAVLSDGRVVLVGVEAARGTTQVLLYDPALNRWVRALSPFETRFGYSTTLLGNGQVLLAGGVDTRGGGAPLSSAVLYDPLRSLLDEQLFLPQVSNPYPYFPSPTPYIGPIVVIDDVVLRDPAVPENMQYVQLRNVINSPVMLGGWQLVNASRPDETRGAVPAYRFPNYLLPRDGVIFVFSGSGTNDLGLGYFFWNQSEPIFQAGDTVELRTSDGQLISRFVVPAQ